MNKKSKFIIFAHARSGSNSVVDLLSMYPEISVMLEPFNENKINWDKDKETYNLSVNLKANKKTIKEIFQKCDGFKHLMYQLPKEQNEFLLNYEGVKIIFLHRRNYLKTAVSAAIAEQDNIWQIEDLKKIGKKVNGYKLLDTIDLKRTIDFFQKSIKQYKDFMVKNNVEFYELIYENLYENSDQKKIRIIKEIIDFLNYSKPDDKSLKEMLKVVSPKRKISSKEKYLKIPNIKEVEKKLGNEEIGFLFK